MTDERSKSPEEALAAGVTEDFERLEQPGAKLVVELAADGRLRAPAQAAREILRDRLRQAEVLPTGPGWTVCRSLEPSADTPALPREVVAAGNIGDSGISIIDFIGFLASGYQTGVLTASCDDTERSIYFYNGDVVWASSQVPEDRLGEFLLRRGKITQEQLQQAIRDGETKIGRACVERGFMAAHELWAMVQAQLIEIFDRLLATKSGVWAFSRISSEVLAESQIHLSTQGLLVDALRRLDELQVYRQRIRSADSIVQRAQASGDPGKTGDLVTQLDGNVQEGASRLLAQLPGTATVHELMQILGKGEFEVTRVLYHLIRANLVELVQTTDTGPIPRRVVGVSKTEAREVISIYSMAIREMFDEMARAGKIENLRGAVADFLKDDQGMFAYLLNGVTVLNDGAIEEHSLLATIQRMTASSQDLSDALSELLFFILFQATDFLGRRRGDDLARRVKLIHGMLGAAQSARLNGEDK